MDRFIRLFDVLPGWLWACVVALLAVLCIRLDVQRAGARTEAAEARSALLSVQVSSRDAILAELQKARLKEAPLMQVVQDANDAVQAARENLAAAAAASDVRMRKLSRSVRVCRADSSAGAATSGGAGEGGAGGAGLREMDGRDLLLVDEQARLDFSRQSASANLVRDSLIECLKGWQGASDATRRGEP